jgi:adenylosuccinate lyase
MHRLEKNILHHAKQRKEFRKYYINYKFNNYTGTETIDEANGHKEAKRLLKEYELSDRFGNYWISQRKCR